MSDRDNELLRMEPEVGLRMRELYHEEGGVHRIYRDWRWGILGALFRRDLDEERRLLFVALSRARQHLCVTSHLPSQFFKDLSQGKGEKPKLRPQPLQVSSTVGDGRRPVLETPDPRPARLTSHDLGGEAVHSGGKGKEHGRRVHQAAELMLRGQVPNDDLEEIARLRELIDSLAGAEQLLSEEECFLPLEGASIRGAVDLVAVFSDRVEIHDFKTDGSRRNEELYHVQVSVYAHAAASLGKPVRCFLQYLSLGLEVELDPLPLDDIQRRVNARLEGNDI